MPGPEKQMHRGESPQSRYVTVSRTTEPRSHRWVKPPPSFTPSIHYFPKRLDAQSPAGNSEAWQS